VLQGCGQATHILMPIGENALLSPSTAGNLPDRFTGVVLYYDKFTSHSSTQENALLIPNTAGTVELVSTGTNLIRQEAREAHTELYRYKEDLMAV
jgi:hypothetical protein